MSMRVMMTLTTRAFLAKVDDHARKQRSIAQQYCMHLNCNPQFVDWKAVNLAIIERWSRSGLERIKRAGWSGRWRGGKLFERLGAA